MAEYYSIVYMHHSLFIHSFVYGHLGCFHVLAIVNPGAMNIGVHVSLSTLVSSGHMPSSGISGSYVRFFSCFLTESPHCLPLWLHQFTSPPTAQEGSLFFTFFSAFTTCQFFDDGHSVRYIFLTSKRNSHQFFTES